MNARNSRHLGGMLLLFGLILVSCDGSRVFENNQDLEQGYWLTDNKPSFQFLIPDTKYSYNVYANFRNELDYPFANIYFKYHLTDSTGQSLKEDLVSTFLYNRKTGEPYGSTVLGDIFDHQVLLLDGYEFDHPGVYAMSLGHYMRVDTLTGILAVGVRVEKNTSIQKN